MNTRIDNNSLNSGKSVYQFQTPGAPQGSYYSLGPNVTPSDLGISPQGMNRATQSVVDKVQVPYRTNQKLQVLKSTASSVDDFWSVPGQVVPTKGGGTQIFSANKGAFDPLN